MSLTLGKAWFGPAVLEGNRIGVRPVARNPRACETLRALPVLMAWLIFYAIAIVGSLNAPSPAAPPTRGLTVQPLPR
jgi:hypothetical protein